MTESEEIAEALNNLIRRCAKSGGHIFIVDKRQNNFALRLTEDIKINTYIPSGKGGDT